MKYTITIESDDGQKVIYQNINERDFQLKLENDLEVAPNFIGNWLTPAPYSKGMRLSLSAYIPNENKYKDMNEAIEINAKNAGKL